MVGPSNSDDERCQIELGKGELTHIRHMLEKATMELERNNLSEAHEALLAGRRTYEQVAAMMAKLSGEADGDRQVFILHLTQSGQAISRSERRLAAHMNAPKTSSAT